MPLFGVIVGTSHHNLDLLSPIRPELKNFLVNTYGNRTGEGNDHGLSGKLILTVLFVMLQDITHEGINGFRRSKNLFQMRHLVHALFNLLRGGSFICQGLILCINGLNGLLIKLQIHDTGLIEHGACGAIFDGLRHIVDIDIVTEDFSSILIFLGYRCPSESYERGVRKGVVDDTGHAHADLAFRVDLLLESVLSAMRFICHYNDIPTFRKRFVGFLELLHRSKDDAIGFTPKQQFLEIVTARRLDWFLAKEVLTLGELSIELVIEIITVCNNNDGGLIQNGLNQMGIENHRERFSAALRVPENTNLSIGVGGTDGAVNSLLDCKVLMVASKDLGRTSFINTEASEVLDEIEETVTLEHSNEEGIVIHEIFCFLKSVPCFPFHETVFLASNGTSLRESHVAHHAEDVVNE